jgi:hypothetical protein
MVGWRVLLVRFPPARGPSVYGTDCAGRGRAPFAGSGFKRGSLRARLRCAIPKRGGCARTARGGRAPGPAYARRLLLVGLGAVWRDEVWRGATESARSRGGSPRGAGGLERGAGGNLSQARRARCGRLRLRVQLQRELLFLFLFFLSLLSEGQADLLSQHTALSRVFSFSLKHSALSLSNTALRSSWLRPAHAPPNCVPAGGLLHAMRSGAGSCKTGMGMESRASLTYRWRVDVFITSCVFLLTALSLSTMARSFCVGEEEPGLLLRGSVLRMYPCQVRQPAGGAGCAGRAARESRGCGR